MIEHRPATLADASKIVGLYNRSEARDGIPRVLDVDELIDEFTSDAVDLERNSLLAIADGEIVGLVYVYFRPSEVVEQRCLIEGLVDPEWRGHGIGQNLVGWAVDRSRMVLAECRDDLAKFIRVQGYVQQESLHRLAARSGFVPVRYSDEMLRPLTELPQLVTVPGVTIVAWPADRDEEIRLTKNTAFLDHWGSIPISADGWHEQVRGFGGSPQTSLIAVDDDDAVVALLFSARYEADDELLGRRHGWIQTLATLRAWRGRGIGSALIARALHAYAEAGWTHASLSVDTENPSGAAHLYRRLGFEPQHRIITHQIALD